MHNIQHIQHLCPSCDAGLPTNCTCPKFPNRKSVLRKAWTMFEQHVEEQIGQPARNQPKTTAAAFRNAVKTILVVLPEPDNEDYVLPVYVAAVRSWHRNETRAHTNLKTIT